MSALSLPEYVEKVTELVDGQVPADELVPAIAELKKRLLLMPDLLPASFLEKSPNGQYSRNLLHCDPEGRFVVMALIWEPEARTPVHDHQSWGVVGIYDEKLGVLDFDPASDCAPLSEKAPLLFSAGDVVEITPPRLSNIHQMSNPHQQRAVSIHTYGDRGVLCRVYNPKTGETQDNSLSFHNSL